MGNIEELKDDVSGQDEGAESEKTFTQEQLNAIIKKRLGEQRQQHENELSEKEKELNRREMTIKAKELLSEKGLPKEMADFLRYETDEELKNCIDIMERIKGSGADESGFTVYGDNRLPKSDYDNKNDAISRAFKNPAFPQNED